MNIYTYLDFRKYLKDKLAQQKAEHRYFSYRYFARVAGLSSPSYLKMVMDGKRNLTPTTIHQFAKAFKLAKKETDYFEALVLFNQAKAEKEKELYFERLAALRPTTALTGLDKDQYEYFTQPHFVVIREMVALPHFQEDPRWIAARLRRKVKGRDVEHALHVLKRLGLIVRNDDGRLVQSDAAVTTPPEVTSFELVKFQRIMLDDAKEALLNVPQARRDISTVTVPIPLSSLPKIKQRIQAFREEILDFINQGDDQYDAVYQLNLQLFPLTKIER